MAVVCWPHDDDDDDAEVLLGVELDYLLYSEVSLHWTQVPHFPTNIYTSRNTSKLTWIPIRKLFITEQWNT